MGKNYEKWGILLQYEGWGEANCVCALRGHLIIIRFGRESRDPMYRFRPRFGPPLTLRYAIIVYIEKRFSHFFCSMIRTLKIIKVAKSNQFDGDSK